MKKSGVVFLSLILALGAVALLGFGAYYLATKPPATMPNGVTPISDAPIPTQPYADWTSFTSPRFNYTFYYPNDWSFSPYDELDQSIIYGTHTLSSYDMSQIEKYQDHGIVDWSEFVGSSPAFKVDISVQALSETRTEFLSRLFAQSKKMPSTDLSIDQLETAHYKTIDEMSGQEVNSYVAFFESNSIVISIYQYNPFIDKDNPVSSEQASLSKVFDSFKFK